MPPQVGKVGSTPRPRKLKLASALIARAKLKLDRIKIGAKTLGKRWRHRRRALVEPNERAATMYSFCLAESTAPRTIRANCGMPPKLMTKINAGILGPTMAKIKSASKVRG